MNRTPPPTPAQFQSPDSLWDFCFCGIGHQLEGLCPTILKDILCLNPLNLGKHVCVAYPWPSNPGRKFSEENPGCPSHHPTGNWDIDPIK